jgi:hypothetical protein
MGFPFWHMFLKFMVILYLRGVLSQNKLHSPENSAFMHFPAAQKTACVSRVAAS